MHVSIKTTLLAAMALAAPAVSAQELDAVTFGTNWLAQAEHGGYYQAVADGTYEKYGLDVSIRQGGPQAPNGQLLIAGQLDFYMGGMSTIDSVKEGIPVLAVASIFRKTPRSCWPILRQGSPIWPVWPARARSSWARTRSLRATTPG